MPYYAISGATGDSDATFTQWIVGITTDKDLADAFLRKLNIFLEAYKKDKNTKLTPDDPNFFKKWDNYDFFTYIIEEITALEDLIKFPV